MLASDTPSIFRLSTPPFLWNNSGSPFLGKMQKLNPPGIYPSSFTNVHF